MPLSNIEAYADARLLTPYDETDPALGAEVIVSVGRDSQSKRFQPKPMPLAALVAMFSHHKVGEKDGPCVVFADMVPGQRLKSAIKAIHAIGLDLDDGVPSASIDAALKKLGVLAWRYTTHSHMKARSEFPKDALVKWAAKNADGAEVDDDLVRLYMREKGKVAKAICDTAIIAGIEHKTAGLMVQVDHAPIPKNRVVIPLKKPFVIADEGQTTQEGQDRWKAVVRATAAQLGLSIDEACLDVSRLFFMPRHAKGRPCEISLCGGELFDWRSLDLDNCWEAEVARLTKGRSKSTTDEGRALGRWSMKAAHGFQVVQAIEDHRPERMRHQVTNGWEIECPFDEEHSNPGDPDDRACMAVNAGDGPSDFFTVSCRHASCREFTNLDMLGKMIGDGWFGREVLEDESYNIAEAEDAQGGDRAPQPQCDGFDERGRDFADYDEAVDYLKPVVAMLAQKGKARVVVETQSGLQFMTKEDAGTWFGAFRVVYEDGKGKIVNRPALPALLTSPLMTRFSAIDCDPSDRLPPHVLNTWEGLAVDPRPGDCGLILDHLLHSTCAEDREHFETLLDFLAHMFQRPHEKPGFAPVLIGPKGCGKSTLGDLLCRIIGPKHSTKISKGKHLTGAFNAHQSSKLLIQAEEVTFGGSRADEGPLKDAITSTRTLIEPKGLDAYEARSFARYMIISNPDHVVPAGEDERRWFVLSCVDRFGHLPAGNVRNRAAKAYFDALYGEADRGGLEAFLHRLMTRDISGFDRFRAPVTAALAEQIAMSLPDEVRWLYGVLQDGQFTTRDGEVLGDRRKETWELDYESGDEFTIDTGDLRRSFDSHVRRYGGSSGGQNAVLDVLKQFGDPERFRRSTGDRPWAYRFGGRWAWQAKFTARYGISFEDQREGGCHSDAGHLQTCRDAGSDPEAGELTAVPPVPPRPTPGGTAEIQAPRGFALIRPTCPTLLLIKRKRRKERS